MAVMTLFCMLCPQRAQAATAPSVTLKAVSNPTTTNAQINASIKNPSRTRLKKCGFILYNSAGKQLANKYDSINYTLKSFNGWFDLNRYYGKLQAGTTYKYKFYVMNSSGSYYYSAVGSFATKGAAKASVATTAVNAAQNAINVAKQALAEAKKQSTANAAKQAAAVCKSKLLNYNASKIKAIGPQPSGSSYCSVYAISYARAVAGKTPYKNPLAYWTKNGALWSLGGMKSRKYGSQQSGLKKLYDEINAGRPAIAYVYGKNTKQHYVTVIGYQNVTNINSLKMSNFIMLDPGYGTQRSLGRYSGLKMTSNNRGYQIITF